jgi:hypothetical protein
LCTYSQNPVTFKKSAAVLERVLNSCGSCKFWHCIEEILQYLWVFYVREQKGHLISLSVYYHHHYIFSNTTTIFLVITKLGIVAGLFSTYIPWACKYVIKNIWMWKKCKYINIQIYGIKHYYHFTKAVPYFPVDNACYLYIKRSKFVKNEHARYTVEYFPVDNARVIYTKGLNL